jgi:hypothetical protein
MKSGMTQPGDSPSICIAPLLKLSKNLHFQAAHLHRHFCSWSEVREWSHHLRRQFGILRINGQVPWSAESDESEQQHCRRRWWRLRRLSVPAEDHQPENVKFLPISKVVAFYKNNSIYSSDEVIANDGLALKPKALYTWLTRVMYNRRNKFDPLWNNYLVGGMQDGVP